MLDFIFCQGHSGRIRAQKLDQNVLAVWFLNETGHFGSGGKNSRSLSNGTYCSWYKTQKVITAPPPIMRMRSSGFCLTVNPHYTLYWERKMKLFAQRNAQIWYCSSFSHNFKWRRGTSPCIFAFHYSRDAGWTHIYSGQVRWGRAWGHFRHRLKTDRWITQGLLRVLHQI